MIASKSLIALAVVALATIASGVLADEHTEQCIKVLSNSLADVTVSREVHEFMQLVRKTLPGVAAEDYGTLERDSRVAHLETAFPLDDCNDLLDQVDELTMKALEGNELCRRVLSDDESGVLELAKKDSVLAHVYEAKESCFAFPPQGGAH